MTKRSTFLGTTARNGGACFQYFDFLTAAERIQARLGKWPWWFHPFGPPPVMTQLRDHCAQLAKDAIAAAEAAYVRRRHAQ